MTRTEARDVLNLYRNWNAGQTSVSLAFSGIRTAEDDILDARRAMLLEATKAMSQPVAEAA